MQKIQVIAGSTRPVRIGRQVAEWVLGVMAAENSFEWELVDLLEWPLPNDEPSIPASGQYVQEHTKAWSKKIGEAAGYVFVTPQYNWGYPASLKNALDHLYGEWVGKAGSNRELRAPGRRESGRATSSSAGWP